MACAQFSRASDMFLHTTVRYLLPFAVRSLDGSCAKGAFAHCGTGDRDHAPFVSLRGAFAPFVGLFYSEDISREKCITQTVSRKQSYPQP